MCTRLHKHRSRLLLTVSVLLLAAAALPTTTAKWSPLGPKVFRLTNDFVGGSIETPVEIVVPRGQYRCPDGIVLNHARASLVLEAGVQIYFSSTASLQVHAGMLDIRGAHTPTNTLSKLVLLSNAGPESPFPEANAETWPGISFAPPPGLPVFTMAVMSNIVGCRVVSANVDIQNARVTVTNMLIDGGVFSDTGSQMDVLRLTNVAVEVPPDLAPQSPGLFVHKSKGSVQMKGCAVRGGTLEINEPSVNAAAGIVRVADTAVWNAATSGVRIISTTRPSLDIEVVNVTVTNCGLALGSYGIGRDATNVVTPPFVGRGGEIIAGLVIIPSPSSRVVVTRSTFDRIQPSALWIGGGRDAEVSFNRFSGTMCFRSPDKPTPPPAVADDDDYYYIECDDQEAPTAGLVGLTGAARILNNVYEDNDTPLTVSVQAGPGECSVTVARNVMRLNSGYAALYLSTAVSMPLGSIQVLVDIHHNRLCADENGHEIRLGSLGLAVSTQDNIFGGCCGSPAAASGTELRTIDMSHVYDDDEDPRLPAVNLQLPSSGPLSPIQGVPEEGQCPLPSELPPLGGGIGNPSSPGVSAISACTLSNAHTTTLLGVCSLEDDDPFLDGLDGGVVGGVTMSGDAYFMVVNTISGPRMYKFNIALKEGSCEVHLDDVCFFDDELQIGRVEGISPANTEGKVYLLFFQQMTLDGEGTLVPAVGEFDTKKCKESGSRFRLPTWVGGDDRPGGDDNFNLRQSQDGNSPYKGHGLKSLTTQPDGTFVWAGTEQSLQEDSLSADGVPFGEDDHRASRIVKLNSETRASEGEYIYVNDPVPTTFAENGLVELLSLDDAGTFLALERAVNADGTAFSIRVYTTNFLFGPVDVWGIDTVRDFEIMGSAPKKLLFDLEVDFDLVPPDIQAMGFIPSEDENKINIVLSSLSSGSTNRRRGLKALPDADILPTYVVLQATLSVSDAGPVLAQTLFNDIPSHVPRGNDRIYLKRRARKIMEEHLPSSQCNKVRNKGDEMKTFLNACPTGVHYGCCISLISTVESLLEWNEHCC